jgi:hypothetical protein
MIKLPISWNQNKLALVLSNALFCIALIMLGNSGVLPLDTVNFAFFTFVALLFALYRPGWAFLFFVGVIPLEIINIAPSAFGADLRPYQWLAIIIFTAVMLRSFARKLPFDLVKPRWFDWVLLLVPVGAFIAAAYAPDTGTALKQAIITLSFGIVYAVGRIFWQSADDVKQAVPFFLGSSLVVSAYALWQNLRFLAGTESFEVMAGRPNATFSEADWLGLFVIVVVSVLYGIVYQVFFSKGQESISYPVYRIPEWVRKPKMWLVIVALVLSYIVLIITVARSAWLGAIGSAAVFAMIVWFREGMRVAAKGAFLIASTACAALILVFLLHLTSFDLSNRAQSTASGLQEITVACEQDSTVPILPYKISSAGELAAFHCRHIMLEEIGAEQAAGRFVTKVYRDDPNVSIRQEIYTKTWDEIKEHSITGIGWGSIASVLGTDARGAGLNASNVFLEIWLGSGLVGLIAFSLVWFGIAVAASIRLLRGQTSGDEPFLIFLLSAWAGITVFDLFNSGILLGFFFLYLSLGGLILQKNYKFKITSSK